MRSFGADFVELKKLKNELNEQLSEGNKTEAAKILNRIQQIYKNATNKDMLEDKEWKKVYAFLENDENEAKGEIEK